MARLSYDTSQLQRYCAQSVIQNICVCMVWHWALAHETERVNFIPSYSYIHLDTSTIDTFTYSRKCVM